MTLQIYREMIYTLSISHMARLQYLQCVSDGVTEGLLWAININPQDTCTTSIIASLVAPDKLLEMIFIKIWWIYMYYCKGMILCMSHSHVLYNLLEIKLLLLLRSVTWRTWIFYPQHMPHCGHIWFIYNTGHTADISNTHIIGHMTGMVLHRGHIIYP